MIDEQAMVTPPEVQASVIDIVENSMWPEFLKERARLVEIDKWYKGNPPVMSSGTSDTREMKRLKELSTTPWLGLVVTTVAQAMFVDGFKTPSGVSLDPIMDTWAANSMNARQTAIHRSALGYGYSYGMALPGTTMSGENRALVRGVSPKQAFAVYEDLAWDEWPEYAIKVDWQNLACTTANVQFYDDTFVHYLKYDTGKEKPFSYVGAEPHGSAVVPFVRYNNLLDLDGNSPGEVAPFIPVANRINKTLYDRLVGQHFRANGLRWISGLSMPDEEELANFQKLKASQADIFVFEDVDTKMDVIRPDSISDFISAAESDIEYLAAVSQLPNHLLSGQMVNLSAEALAAARAPLTQKIAERQVTFGNSHVQLMRLAAKLEGRDDIADDYHAHVSWQDMEIRSISQAADALGKLAQSLAVPRDTLWRMLPGVTEQDAQEWEKKAMDKSPLSEYLRSFDKKQDTASGPEKNPLDTKADKAAKTDPTLANAHKG